jgi:hypothetical protein
MQSWENDAKLQQIGLDDGGGAITNRYDQSVEVALSNSLAHCLFVPEPRTCLLQIIFHQEFCPMSSNPPEVLLSQLKKLGRQHKDALFACGGSLTIDKPVRIHFTERGNQGSTAANGVVTIPQDSNHDMKQLIAACEPSGFGKGKELVHDETYRSAFELSTDRFFSSFQLAEHDIMSEIHRLLAPNAASVRAKPYKLNVYKQGGFFKAHVDTPRGGNMFGTLVVCLPSSFSGGDFEVEHNGQKHVFAWGSDDSEKSESEAAADSGEEEKVKEAIAPETLSFAVRWCAFYSDCSHEVLEVKSGYRATLTFLLENDVLRDLPSAVDKNPFTASLAKMLTEKQYSGKSSASALRWSTSTPWTA